jgi:hypothetical protein
VSSRDFFLICVACAAGAFGVALLIGNDYAFFAGYVVLQFIVLAQAWNILGGGERILRAVVQFVQQRPEALSLLLVLGEIHERGELLHDIAGLIPNRADEDGGPERAAVVTAETDFQNRFWSLRRRLRPAPAPLDRWGTPSGIQSSGRALVRGRIRSGTESCSLSINEMPCVAA